jgi:hypothetical protein
MCAVDTSRLPERSPTALWPNVFILIIVIIIVIIIIIIIIIAPRMHVQGLGTFSPRQTDP